MKKFLSVLLSALLVVAAFAIPVAAVNWEDGQIQGYNPDKPDDYTFDNAYGYVFNINAINTAVVAEGTIICTTTEAYNAASLGWCNAVILDKVEDNVYAVNDVILVPQASVNTEDEDTTNDTWQDVANVNLTNGQIILAPHSSYSNPQGTNWQAKVAAMALKVGDKLTFSGVDFAAGTVDNATATVQDAPEGYVPTLGVNDEEEPTNEPKMFWVTHVNNNTVEGSGVIFTDAYTGAGWWIHVAFAPVEGAEGVFEITAISDGTLDGHGVAQEIPEGGFVWASNYGNDYSASEGIDYTSPNCSAAIEDAKSWTVGMKFVFDGIDPLNPEIPTSTSGVEWYNDAYVCTATYTVYDETNTSDPDDDDDDEEDLEAVLKEFVGEASEDAKFDLEINAPETYKAGDEITVTVTVKNITAENGLHVVNFNLYYDCDKLVLTNDLDEEDDNRLVCIDENNLPSKWENFTKVNNDFDAEKPEGTVVNADNDGIIYASALTDKDTAATAIKEDGAVVFTFTFTAVEDAEGDIGIAIPNAEVEGALNNEAGAELYAGNGGYVIIANDDAQEDESSEADPVVPGDASNMLVFAIIALVAIAGSAVVIKTRR